MIERSGPAPWEFKFPFPGSLTSTFLAGREGGPVGDAGQVEAAGNPLTRI